MRQLRTEVTTVNFQQTWRVRVRRNHKFHRCRNVSQVSFSREKGTRTGERHSYRWEGMHSYRWDETSMKYHHSIHNTSLPHSPVTALCRFTSVTRLTRSSSGPSSSPASLNWTEWFAALWCLFMRITWCTRSIVSTVYIQVGIWLAMSLHVRGNACVRPVICTADVLLQWTQY